RHTRSKRDWSSDVCSSDLLLAAAAARGECSCVFVYTQSGDSNQQPKHWLSSLALLPVIYWQMYPGAVDTLPLAGWLLQRESRYRSEERRVGKGGRSRRKED